MSFTICNPVQACVWLASHDDGAVSSLPKECTFAELAFHHELNVIASDEDFVPVDENTSYAQIFEGLDARAAASDRFAKAGKADKAKAALWCTDRPGTAWIEAAKRELLGACYAGALTMTGRSLYGGSSQEIPAAAFATLQFFERDGADCLGPPNRADADCWCDLVLQAGHVRAVFGPNDAPKAPPRRTGRPREWDWDAAMAHLTAVANRPNGLPDVQADAERIVEKYFADRNDGTSPAPSGIRKKVGAVYLAVAQMKTQREQARKRPGHL